MMINDVYEIARKLTLYMKKCNLKSFDPYDMPYIPCNVNLYDFYNWRKQHPTLSKFITLKTKASITSAMFADTCFSLYLYDNDEKWIKYGKEELEWLIKNKSIYGYSWGLPFDWNMGNNDCLAKSGTPFSTLSIYMLDAFLNYKKISGDTNYDDVISYIPDLFTKHLKQIKTIDTMILSYSPIDELYANNVNSYAAATLCLVQHTTGEIYNDHIHMLLNSLIEEQHEDGSWEYYTKHQNRTGCIDSLHQIYILQNLERCYRLGKYTKLKIPIQRGMKFVEDNFITEDNNVKKFVNDGQEYELIDIAELIYLYIIRKDIKKSYIFMNSLIKTFKIFEDAPHFISKIGVDIPFFRWGISQTLHTMGEYICQNR